MADMNDPVVKRLLYRSKYTGTKETDELLGRFAQRYIPEMTDAHLAQFSALIENADPDLYMWISNRRPVPPEWDTEVMAMLRAYSL